MKLSIYVAAVCIFGLSILLFAGKVAITTHPAHGNPDPEQERKRSEAKQAAYLKEVKSRYHLDLDLSKMCFTEDDKYLFVADRCVGYREVLPMVIYLFNKTGTVVESRTVSDLVGFLKQSEPALSHFNYKDIVFYQSRWSDTTSRRAEITFSHEEYSSDKIQYQITAEDDHIVMSKY